MTSPFGARPQLRPKGEFRPRIDFLSLKARITQGAIRGLRAASGAENRGGLSRVEVIGPRNKGWLSSRPATAPSLTASSVVRTVDTGADLLASGVPRGRGPIEVGDRGLRLGAQRGNSSGIRGAMLD